MRGGVEAGSSLGVVGALVDVVVRVVVAEAAVTVSVGGVIVRS